MVDILIPFLKETKNFWRYQLDNGIYIISIYLPKKEYPVKENKVKVCIEKNELD